MSWLRWINTYESNGLIAGKVNANSLIHLYPRKIADGRWEIAAETEMSSAYSVSYRIDPLDYESAEAALMAIDSMTKRW